MAPNKYLCKKILSLNKFVNSLKVLFKTSIFSFLIINSIKSDDVVNKLKEIEKRLESNQLIEKKLKKKQNKIDSNIRVIENLLKKNETNLKKQYSKRKDLLLEINNHENSKEEIKVNISSLYNKRSNIINIFLKDSFSQKKDKAIDYLLVSIFKSANQKIDNYKIELDKIDNSLYSAKKQLLEIELKLEDTNNNFKEKSNLETSLQGENIITVIQRKEKELETAAIGKEAKELKKLIESLKNNSKNKIKTKNRSINLTKIEDLLPVKLKNIQKMRTDRAKKGIFLTLKKKSFLTTPYDGLIVYADSFKGYGNMIILDLGNNYHIIYSGLTSIMCSVGDWVKAGKTLGKIELKYNKNEVYLEVRFKGKTVNPVSWIKS